jgi:hypothetical protein
LFWIFWGEEGSSEKQIVKDNGGFLMPAAITKDRDDPLIDYLESTPKPSEAPVRIDE